jgi:hypothetical protein
MAAGQELPCRASGMAAILVRRVGVDARVWMDGSGAPASGQKSGSDRNQR